MRSASRATPLRQSTQVPNTSKTSALTLFADAGCAQILLVFDNAIRAIAPTSAVRRVASMAAFLLSAPTEAKHEPGWSCGATENRSFAKSRRLGDRFKGNTSRFGHENLRQYRPEHCQRCYHPIGSCLADIGEKQGKSKGADGSANPPSRNGNALGDRTDTGGSEFRPQYPRAGNETGASLGH